MKKMSGYSIAADEVVGSKIPPGPIYYLHLIKNRLGSFNDVKKMRDMYKQ